MTKIKRILTLFLLIFSFSYKINAQSDFRLSIVSREVKTVMGVQHQKLNVVMRFNGKETNQQINYMGANPKINPNISVVALDNYLPMDMQRGTLLGQIATSQKRYPERKIVSAVNGDFFDINSRVGQQSAATVGPHVRDGNVMFEGYGNLAGSYSVGIKTDGTPFISRPSYDSGYYIEVVDEDGSVKQKDLKVKINKLPSNPNDLAVFLSSFGGEPSSITGKKMLIKINEKVIHKALNGSDLGRYFVKGKIESITEDELDLIPEDIMVLVGNDFFLDDLINENDTVRLQKRPSGDFKGVFHAVSGLHGLVENGVVLRPAYASNSYEALPAPRTAAGIKADGTIFFVVVDGRQAPQYAGVSLEELGEIMVYFGAVMAINLDGGGSSAIVVLDEKTDTYVTHNSPSDGGHRSDANGIGFIYGPQNLPLPPTPFPDTRPFLNQVNGILLEGNKITFNPVPNADRYVVMVDGKRYETTNSELSLDLDPGFYDVNIKAYGEHNVYRQSKSETFEIELYSTTMQDIMDSLLSYGKNIHQFLGE